MTEEPPERAFEQYLARVEPRRPRRTIPRRDIVIASILGLIFLMMYLGPLIATLWP